MNKYTLAAVIELASTFFIVSIIFAAGIFNNYWLLLLLLFVGTSDYQKELLGVKE